MSTSKLIELGKVSEETKGIGPVDIEHPSGLRGMDG